MIESSVQLVDSRLPGFIARPHMLMRKTADRLQFGMTLFDANYKLVLGNSSYQELYRLPARFIQEGTRLDDVLHHHAASRSFSSWSANPEMQARNWLKHHIYKLRTLSSYTAVHNLADGSLVEATYSALPDGGWLGVQRFRHENMG